MDLLKPVKAVINKVKTGIDNTKTSLDEANKEIEQDKKLQKWRKRMEVAKNVLDLQIMDEREAIYLGTRDVDRNVNSGAKPSKRANNIYNIAFEMIESQVNTQIPQPSVKSKRPKFEEQAKMVEDSIGNDLKEIGIEEINDMNERITPIQGFSNISVDWDPDFKHHLYRGELKLTSKHPKQIIPQPRVWNIQKMEYFFILSSVTKEYVKRRYDVDLPDQEQEQYPEVNSLLNNGGMVASNTDDALVTEIVCWYKDDKGDIGKFVWCNDIPLEDLPKYFYRRDEQGNIMEEETLATDVIISDGTTVQAGTQVPYFVPTRYPVVVRINVPKNFTFGGQSDIDVIRDQQDSIKKTGTKVEEKVMKGGIIITMSDNLNQQITNETYQVVKGSLQDLGSINTKELTANISQDMEYIEQQRRTIQQMLGITNSYQGLQDTTAHSGVAKQIQVQQASGRMQSKLVNKYAAFKELFEIMFEFKLAFYDELRPYLSKDPNGNDQYGEFNKYAFLCKDASGQYFYNTDFMFSADAGSGLPKDPMFIFQQAENQLKEGAIDKMQYWTIMESLHFPQAKEIKSQIEEQMQQQQMMAQQSSPQQPADPMQQATGGLHPHEQQALANASPEQLAMIQQHMAGGQGG